MKLRLADIKPSAHSHTPKTGKSFDFSVSVTFLVATPLDQRLFSSVCIYWPVDYILTSNLYHSSHNQLEEVPCVTLSGSPFQIVNMYLLTPLNEYLTYTWLFWPRELSPTVTLLQSDHCLWPSSYFTMERSTERNPILILRKGTLVGPLGASSPHCCQTGWMLSNKLDALSEIFLLPSGVHIVPTENLTVGKCHISSDKTSSNGTLFVHQRPCHLLSTIFTVKVTVKTHYIMFVLFEDLRLYISWKQQSKVLDYFWFKLLTMDVA